MPELPKKKVGIVACSGEELAEGTVTRLAALKVLEQLRPADTVTICLPLFLAGGEGDRAFARFYPTVAIDGCRLRCAARATEMYSGKPAASVVVSDLCEQHSMGKPEGRRKLNPAGSQAVETTAERVAGLVDELLGKNWSRRKGSFVEEGLPVFEATRESASARERGGRNTTACACGSGIPVQSVNVNGRSTSLIALPLILEQFYLAGKKPDAAVTRELMEAIRIYNPIPEDEDESYQAVLLQEYIDYCASQEKG